MIWTQREQRRIFLAVNVLHMSPRTAGGIHAIDIDAVTAAAAILRRVATNVSEHGALLRACASIGFPWQVPLLRAASLGQKLCANQGGGSAWATPRAVPCWAAWPPHRCCRPAFTRNSRISTRPKRRAA